MTRQLRPWTARLIAHTRVVAAALVTALLAAVSLLMPLTVADAAPLLLSQGRLATASSVENPDYTPAAAAFAGNRPSRWSSEWSEFQWLQLDLGSVAAIERVELEWETAHAAAYQTQVSNDGTGWSTSYSTTTSRGGSEAIPVTGHGRYVRLHGTDRATGYGYSLWEFRVLGTPGTTSSPSLTTATTAATTTTRPTTTRPASTTAPATTPPPAPAPPPAATPSLPTAT